MTMVAACGACVIAGMTHLVGQNIAKTINKHSVGTIGRPGSYRIISIPGKPCRRRIERN